MKKYILITVEDGREYDIYEELDTMEGISYRTISTEEMVRECGNMHNKLIRDCAEKVLDETLTEDEFKAMLHDWKVFSRNPEHYSGTIVVDMVKLWLSERRNSSMKKIAEYDRLTVGQLRELINGMDDNIEVSIMGVTYGIKVYTDDTHIILDSEEIL